MQTGSAFTSFLKRWMPDNTSGFCLQLFHRNLLQIFIFDHIYFLAKDISFLPPHWLPIFTLTPCNKKISKVAISFTMLNRRNREHNLYDCFHQKKQLSVTNVRDNSNFRLIDFIYNSTCANAIFCCIVLKYKPRNLQSLAKFNTGKLQTDSIACERV